MKKKENFKILTNILLAIIICAICTVNVNASSERQKAVKIYKSFLTKKKTIVDTVYGKKTIKVNYFYILNIDGKGVPELIITDGNAQAMGGGLVLYYHVYTVKNNKISYCGEYGVRGVDSRDQPTFKYSKKWKGLIATGYTERIYGFWWNMYKISDNKLVNNKHLMEQYKYPGSTKRVYYFGTKDNDRHEITKSEYKKYYKQYFKDVVIYKMQKNTAVNRKKIK